MITRKVSPENINNLRLKALIIVISENDFRENLKILQIGLIHKKFSCKKFVAILFFANISE